jgi:hypothetical protein
MRRAQVWGLSQGIACFLNVQSHEHQAEIVFETSSSSISGTKPTHTSVWRKSCFCKAFVSTTQHSQSTLQMHKGVVLSTLEHLRKR